MLTLVVLISGTGSNMRALLERARHPDFPVRVLAVGADRDAAGLAHCVDFGIPTFTVPFGDFASREEWGEALAQKLDELSPDVIVLSGMMRLLPDAVVRRFAPRILNTHPAFLPEFPGAHAVRDAIAAGVTETGASVIVVDGGVDTGPVLAQRRIGVESGDTEETLHERIKLVERDLLERVLEDIDAGRIDLEEYA